MDFRKIFSENVFEFKSDLQKKGSKVFRRNKTVSKILFLTIFPLEIAYI